MSHFPYKKILLLVNLSRASGRNFMTHVHQNIDKHPDWQLRIIQVQETTPSNILSILKDDTVDGILSTEMEIKPIADFLENDMRPLVVLGTREKCIPRRKANVSFIRHDEETIGGEGAKYLMSLGRFKTFGYVHYSEKAYGYLSSLREKGFREALDAAHIPLATFGNPPYPEADDQRHMKEWLDAIPKPAAILAGCDKRAVEVMAACNQMEIAVPAEISIVSIDNDEFLCHSTTPALSSIQLTYEDAGTKAVSELNFLLRHRTKKQEPRKLVARSACRIFERASTKVLPPGIHLCRRANEYISANADRNIKVSDVVEHLGVSRRLADLRFREFNGETILQAITRIRLQAVARKLRNDKVSIGTIMTSCGFRNAGHLEMLFKRQYGVTLRDYRKAHLPERRPI